MAKGRSSSTAEDWFPGVGVSSHVVDVVYRVGRGSILEATLACTLGT
jgi:hypothetical protein